MQKLRTLIVDDEPLARQTLMEELQTIEGIEIVGQAGDGLAAIRLMSIRAVDLAFLDVQMPILDGFEVVRRLSGPLPSIVFVTAHSEHVLKSFELGVVDYLLKPVSPERLKAAIDRIRQRTTKPVEAARRIARTVDAAGRGVHRTSRIVARNGRDYYLLPLDEIFAIQAEGQTVWILTEDKKYRATESVAILEQHLAGTEFQLMHRGSLINVNKILRSPRSLPRPQRIQHFLRRAGVVPRSRSPCRSARIRPLVHNPQLVRHVQEDGLANWGVCWRSRKCGRV